MIQAGVYIHIGANNEVLYVGQTENMKNRMTYHRNSSPWFNEVVNVTFIPCEGSANRAILERETIRSVKPKHNVRSRWLPSNSEIDKIHYVFTPCAFYDSLKNHFGLTSESHLSEFLGVSKHHIQMVRMRICVVTCAEKQKIAKIIGCTPVDVAYKIGEKPRRRKLRYLLGRAE